MKPILLPITLGVALTAGVSLAPGCGAGYHANQVRTAQDAKRLTVGVVQREVRRGMSGAQVIEVLGSPNIVSTDESGREVWVYDRFATDVVVSDSGWSIFGAGGGFGHGGAGGGGLGLGGRSGAASRTQRTLTIVIKFGEDRKVRDFAYHASRF
jgi:outer membrane protein assembly factor BamE (lipoprotein component of BamABCDE complex)